MSLGNNALKEVIDELDHKYDILAVLSHNMSRQIEYIKSIDVYNSEYYIMSLCHKLMEEITNYLKIRKPDFIIYAIELAAKSLSGHDCQNCSGNHAPQHADHIFKLQESYGKTSGALQKIYKAFPSSSFHNLYSDAYVVLRNQVTTIERTLIDIFFVEEIYLKPKIVSAQNNMNLPNH